MTGEINPIQRPTTSLRLAGLLAASATLASTGCTAFMAPRESAPAAPPAPSAASPVPRELEMMSLPPYTIEPPDILLLNAVKVVPKPPYLLEPFDGILIRAAGALPDQPIADAFFIDPEGMIDLGPSYGKVKVVGLTIDGAKDAIRKQLSEVLEEPEVSVSLAVSSGAQQIVGEHLVGPDGRVNLGTYGSVYVTGMTLEEAKAAIEKQLSGYLENPKVIVDIFSYNSKKYYIITQGGGFGDNVVQLPVTGNETVLDALASLGGISQVSSSKIWIARPARNGAGCEQILPVNYEDITRGASTATNYQILPGDRVFIAEDGLVKFDAVVSKFTRPFERLLGFTSLGAATIDRVQNFPQATP